VGVCLSEGASAEFCALALQGALPSWGEGEGLGVRVRARVRARVRVRVRRRAAPPRHGWTSS